MFTGLITAVGEVQSLNPEPEGLRIAITSPYKGLELGESIAVDGACLTVRDKGRGWFEVQVVRSSLERTLFGDYRPGQRVNLERALQVGDRLGGHLVQGHVDGVAEITDTREREDGRLLTLRLPPAVARITIPLGSITVAGVSLTAHAIPEPGSAQVSLIPFTLERTTLGSLQQGDRVHVEGDTIGKYVEALLQAHGRGSEGTEQGGAAPGGALTTEAWDG